MSYILQLDSSANMLSSTSRSLTTEFARAWTAAAAGREIVRRDLHDEPLPHLPTNALHFTPDRRTDSVPPAAAATALQAELVSELVGADAVVIAAPMYNFAMPSTLKAWIDYVHVYGATAPAKEGISPLRGKPVAIIATRATPTGADQGTDFVLGPIHAILGESMSMAVTGFVVHTNDTPVPGEFHRPVDCVRAQVTAFADDSR